MSELRILLVEDQELNRALVRAIISRTAQERIRDAAVVEAEDLRTARAAIAAARFDVVLLDVQLPDGSGLDLLADMDAGSRTAVVAMTGGVLPYQRTAALDAGCDAVLEKPFVSEDLIGLIDRLVPAG